MHYPYVTMVPFFDIYIHFLMYIYKYYSRIDIYIKKIFMWIYIYIIPIYIHTVIYYHIVIGWNRS